MTTPTFADLACSVYLVQRIELRDPPDPTRKGVDALFAFDYMGSAEFEFGTLPHSLRLMREQPLALRKMRSGEHIAWFIGRESDAPLAEALFADQIGPRAWRLKEWTEIDRAYGVRSDWPSRAVGWWAVQTKHASAKSWVPFAFFKGKAHAETWHEAVR